MSWKTIAFIAILATSAYAVDLDVQQQMDVLRVKLSQKEAELADARAEIARLRVKMHPSDEADSDIAITKTSQFAWGSKKVCKNHCNGNCWLPRKLVDGTCKLTSKYFNKFVQGVVSVGNHSQPAWNIMGGRGYKQIFGTVTCPCTHADGKPMSEEHALRVISGQVSAIGIPDLFAKRSLGLKFKGNPHPGKTRYYGSAWTARLVLATVAMQKCWKKNCAAVTEGGLLSKLTLDLEDDWGGGATC